MKLHTDILLSASIERCLTESEETPEGVATGLILCATRRLGYFVTVEEAIVMRDHLHDLLHTRNALSQELDKIERKQG